MRWVSLRTLRSEKVAAQDIIDARGRVLVRRGVTLTPSIVASLLRLGIHTACIEDPYTDDIYIQGLVRVETHGKVLEATYDTLSDLATHSARKHVKSSKVSKRLRPLMKEVVAECKALKGAGQFLSSIYSSDEELFHHSVNVTLLTIATAIGYGLDDDEVIELSMGTLLHDVGKLRIPESILKKPSKLTEDEYAVIKLHTTYGFEILSQGCDLSPEGLLIALQHHERLDGSGYPNGLLAPDIHEYAKISAVTDVYEALTATRVYRPGYLPHHALEYLLGDGGIHFDTKVIDAFVSSVRVYPVGMTVALSNGYRAVVVHSTKKQSQRPVVRVIEDMNGQAVPQPWEIDLSKELTIEITACES
jgi:HD-GYP domain-containing protein (c-di-GMP phosphodiesterase class II)